MTPATQQEYRKLAAHFYASRIDGAPTPKRIADALVSAAPDYRPAYWRRLRNALAFDQSERGYQSSAERVGATRNPVTMATSGLEVKAKQRRIRAVSVDDERKLLGRLQESQDRQAYGAVMLARITGARPAEMQRIRVDGLRVIIEGAKKSHDGTRGADRVLVVTESEAQMVTACVHHLGGANMGAIQDRLSAAGRKLWPQRAAVPSLYSWRHQLGSELKAAGIDRKEVAYLMGHQSTGSVDRYGSRRTARGGKVPRAPEGEAFENVRERHSEPPTVAKEPMVSAADLERGVRLMRAKEAAASNEKTPQRQGLSEGMSLNR